MHDMIIVGAGPAGLAAAMYATRKRLDYLVLSRDLGGKSNYSIKLPEMEEHQVIRAKELVTIYKSRLEYLRHSYRLEGVSSIRGNADGFTITTDKDATEEARVVVVATGARNKRLDVPGEGKYLSRALGYSSISYSHLFEGKRVFLTGDTDRVLDSAVEMSIHSDAVTLLLLANGSYSKDLVEYVSNLERVNVIREGSIKEFRGDDFAQEAVIATPDGEHVVAADGFFVEPEPLANSAFLKDMVDLGAGGYVQVDATNMTSVPGLFAAGDVTGNGFEQILVALGDGAKAVLSAYRYLLQHGLRSK